MPRKGKRAELEQWLAARRPQRIDAALFAEIYAALAPVSESRLRHLLRESGVPLDPLIEGVRQSGFEELRTTLEALQAAYESGGREAKAAARRLLIEARTHARFAARNPDKRMQKAEMVLWMNTWLENPPLFRAWVRLRLAAPQAEAASPATDGTGL